MKQAWKWAAVAAVWAAGTAGADTKAGWDAWQRGDYRAAVEEWRGPAIAGEADAQFNLGQAYKLGRGVPVDPGLAESWFRKAALQKHPLAEDNYGLALYQGGRKGDAVPWLEKSVARGEPRAQLVLGTMLFNGDSVPRDIPRAYALMTRASQSGLKAASETLAQMDQYVSPSDRQKGTALAARYAADAPAPAQVGGRMVVSSDAPRSAPSPAPTTRTAEARPARAPKPPVEVAARTPAPKPSVQPSTQPKVQPVPKAAAAGRYRVQLGAFRDEGNARGLWSRVGGRIGGSAAYEKAGGITRLIGGSFASQAEAQRACRDAKVSCVVFR